MGESWEVCEKWVSESVKSLNDDVKTLRKEMAVDVKALRKEIDELKKTETIIKIEQRTLQIRFGLVGAVGASVPVLALIIKNAFF